jgi:hypothetical protein
MVMTETFLNHPDTYFPAVALHIAGMVMEYKKDSSFQQRLKQPQ